MLVTARALRAKSDQASHMFSPVNGQLRVFRANLPFLWGILAFLLLIMAIPELATWLPSIARE